MSARIALVTDDSGWHGARLHAAFAARGCEVRNVSLCDCAIDLAAVATGGLHVPGYEDSLPDGVFVRGVPGGSLEQVVLYLDVLHALEALGVPVYNSGRAIEKSVDKGMTSLLLARAGISVPPTWVTSHVERAAEIWMRERAAGHRIVVKPLFGSQGKGLIRLSGNDELPAIDDYQGVFYLQRFVEGARHDWRVFVVDGNAVASMRRQGDDWINNVAQGAACAAERNDKQLGALAVAAVRALDMDYAGVDIMRGADGELQVIEVNSVPAWAGLQSTCDLDIAQCLADDFCTRHVQRPAARAVGL